MQKRLEEGYGPVIQILKYLVNQSLQEGAGAVLAQQGGLSADATTQAKAGILNVSIEDHYYPWPIAIHQCTSWSVHVLNNTIAIEHALWCA